VTTIMGLNGQGKTNLVEAHRLCRDPRQPPRRHRPTAGALRRSQTVIVRPSCGMTGRRSSNSSSPPAGPTEPETQQIPPPRTRDVLGTLRTVLFAPEDLALVKGDPAGASRLPRRPARRATAALGGRARRLRPDPQTAQRPAQTAAPVLRKGPSRRRSASLAPDENPDTARESTLHTLDVWNTHLAEVGAQLLYARLRLLRDLTPFLAAAYEAVSAGTTTVSASYRASVREPAAAAIAAGEVPEPEALRAELLAAFDEHRAAEIERGVTLVGPHRDDVHLSLGPMPAKGYASHGESLVVRAGTQARGIPTAAPRPRGGPGPRPRRRLRRARRQRRERLAELVADCEQVLVTAAVGADVPERLAPAAARMP
jgi:DNA replication and repair protein RecF